MVLYLIAFFLMSSLQGYEKQERLWQVISQDAAGLYEICTDANTKAQSFRLLCEEKDYKKVPVFGTGEHKIEHSMVVLDEADEYYLQVQAGQEKSFIEILYDDYIKILGNTKLERNQSLKNIDLDALQAKIKKE